MKIKLLVLCLFFSTAAYSMPHNLDVVPQVSLVRVLSHSLFLKVETLVSDWSEVENQVPSRIFSSSFDDLDTQLHKYVRKYRARIHLSESQSEMVSFVFISSVNTKLIDALAYYVDKDPRICSQYLDEYRQEKHSLVRKSAFLSRLSTGLKVGQDPWVGLLFQSIPVALQRTLFHRFFGLTSETELVADFTSSFVFDYGKKRSSLLCVKEQKHLIHCYELVLLEEFSLWLQQNEKIMDRIVKLVRLFESELQVMKQLYDQETA